MVPARRPARLLFALVLVLLGASAAQAGDVTAFVTFPSPKEDWARGYGAALTSTWFHVVALEAEAARLPIEDSAGTMTTFSGSALLAPPIGFIVPYGGLGVGLFRQSIGSASDTGTLRCFILGAKLKLGLLVVRGDYRSVHLSGEPLLPMDKRISIGAGISF
jgi:hypothetical protein